MGGQWLSARLDHPLMGIFSRWARWLLFTFGFAFVALEFEWVVAQRPLWILLAISFLIWFLIQTIYVWFAIRRFSLADLPVFPKFVLREDLGEWPTQSQFIHLREWLRKKGYEQIEASHAFLGEETLLRTFNFEDSEKTVRIQVVFTPSEPGPTQAIFTLSSLTSKGLRYVTDNAFLPRAEILPTNWKLKRTPLVRSIAKLETTHLETMKKTGEEFLAWEETPLEDANEQQRIIEKTNVDKGILFAKHLRERNGTFTSEGRYRMWLELWWLKYFGFSKK